MTEYRTDPSFSPERLANLGEGHIAYIRAMRSEDITRIFPGVPDLAPGHKVWALLSANGTPMLLADNPREVVDNAAEQNLFTVSVH